MPYLSEAAIIFWQRQYSGWITLRNQLVTPIRLMGRRVIELYDALLAGNDMEITPRLTLMRRPGYLQYAPAVMNGTLLNTYTWKTASNGVFQIFDTTVDIEYITPGQATPTVVFTKPAGTTNNKTYFFGVGNYLFFSGLGFSGKWDGPQGKQGVTNWGIGGIVGGTFGPTTATTGVDTPNVLGGTAWTNPSAVTGTLGFATCSVPKGTASDYLDAGGFGFAIPTSDKLAGIKVTMNLAGTGNGYLYVTLFNKDLGFYFGSKFIDLPTGNSTPSFTTFGGPTDYFADSDGVFPLNGNFIVRIYFYNTFSQTTSVTLNDVIVTVYTASPITATPFGSGTFSAVNGYSYTQAFGNSVSGEISNATQPSANTGPFSNKAGVNVSVIASTDTQVDQIHVYRTTDSGGGSLYAEISNSPFPNITGTVVDTTPDNQLQQNNLAALNLQNTPPPANLVAMEWFAGRLWGMVGSTLYASTGPDSLSGLQQSNWNPAYVYVCPTPGVRLLAIPNGMLVHTVDDCLIVRGTATLSFTVNEFMRDLAVRNYNAVDSDGSNIYVFTTDRQFLSMGAAGMNDIGQSIADQLQNIDPTQVYVTVYRFGLDAMIFILDTVNNIIYPYNLNQQCWCLPAILQIPGNACGAMETTVGVWKFILGSGTSLAQRDLNTFTDLGASYSPQVLFGSISVADPGTLAKEDALFLELTNAGNLPTNVMVLPNDAGATLTNPVGSQITGTFSELAQGANPQPDAPTYAAKAANYRSLRYYWSAGNVPQAIKHLQILIKFGNEAAQNEIIGLGIGGKQSGDSPGVGAIPQLQGH